MPRILWSGVLSAAPRGREMWSCWWSRAFPDALRAHDLARLAIDQPVRQAIQAYLDQYRLLATTLQVREPDYLAVKVQARSRSRRTWRPRR